MVSADLFEDIENLNGELSSGGHNYGTNSVEFSPLGAVESLKDGDKEGQRLSASCLGSTHDIFALKGERNSSGLHIGEGLEVRGLEACSGRSGKRKLGEILDFF